MANQNSNNRISDEELNLTGVYGMEDFMGGSNQNIEDLAGYNLGASEWNMPMNNGNMNENMMNMQSSNGRNAEQSMMHGAQNNMSRQQEQRANQMVPQPQRQEQTMPNTRNPQGSANLSGNNNWVNMQPNSNIETFLRTQIGKNVRMQFLIGTNTLIEKSGKLVSVGDDFVVLREAGSDEILVCDFNDAKFIRFEDMNS